MTDSLPPQRAETPWWPKLSVAFLSMAIIGLLAWYVLPYSSTSPDDEVVLYEKALSEYQVAEEDLGLAAGQAILVLRAAHERNDTDSTNSPEGVDKLRVLLEIEPPKYEPRALDTLTPQEAHDELLRVELVCEELKTLTHKLSRQAAKVEEALKQSR